MQNRGPSFPPEFLGEYDPYNYTTASLARRAPPAAQPSKVIILPEENWPGVMETREIEVKLEVAPLSVTTPVDESEVALLPATQPVDVPEAAPLPASAVPPVDEPQLAVIDSAPSTPEKAKLKRKLFIGM